MTCVGGTWLSNQKNTNPSWIIYRPDTVTPANEFPYYETSGTQTITYFLAPLDVQNLAVQDYLFNYQVNTVGVSATRYDGFAIDNVTSRNVWQRAYSNGNTVFVPTKGLLTGSKTSDPNYAYYVANYIESFTQKANQRRLTTIINNTYNVANSSDYTLVSNKANMVFDETGYTRHAAIDNKEIQLLDPSSCSTKTSSSNITCSPIPNYVDNATTGCTTWSDRTRRLQDITKNKPFAIVDKICYSRSQLKNEHLDWPLANFLLIKEEYSYLALTAIKREANESSYYEFPQLYVFTGSPVSNYAQSGNIYYRRFTNALALVNPYSDTNRIGSYQIPALTEYIGINGNIYKNTVTLAPATALFLTKFDYWYLTSSWTSLNSSLQVVNPSAAHFTYKLTESNDAAGTAPVHMVTNSMGVEVGQPWTLTVDLKAAGRDSLVLFFEESDTTGNTKATISTACKLTGLGAVSPSAGATSTITQLTSSTYRCSLSGDALPNNSTGRLKVGFKLAVPGTAYYQGNGTNGVEISNISLVKSP